MSTSTMSTDFSKLVTFKQVDNEMQKQLVIIDDLAKQINNINKKEEEIKHSNLNSIDDKTIFLYQFIGILNHINFCL